MYNLVSLHFINDLMKLSNDKWYHPAGTDKSMRTYGILSTRRTKVKFSEWLEKFGYITDSATQKRRYCDVIGFRKRVSYSPTGRGKKRERENGEEEEAVLEREEKPTKVCFGYVYNLLRETTSNVFEMTQRFYSWRSWTFLS